MVNACTHVCLQPVEVKVIPYLLATGASRAVEGSPHARPALGFRRLTADVRLDVVGGGLN